MENKYLHANWVSFFILLGITLAWVSNAQANDDDIIDFIPAILSAAQNSPAHPPQIDFTGTWTIHEDASSLDPYCAGSVDYTVTVTDLGDGTFSVDFRQKVVQGVMVGESLVVSFAGTYPEDGGTTTSEFSGTFIYDSTAGYSASGREDWSWTDGDDSCSGVSIFTGFKNTP